MVVLPSPLAFHAAIPAKRPNYGSNPSPRREGLFMRAIRFLALLAFACAAACAISGPARAEPIAASALASQTSVSGEGGLIQNAYWRSAITGTDNINRPYYHHYYYRPGTSPLLLSALLLPLLLSPALPPLRLAAPLLAQALLAPLVTSGASGFTRTVKHEPFGRVHAPMG